MINIMKAIQELRPGAECRIYGDTYSGIIWDDKNQTLPTEDEVNKKLKELQEGEPMKLLREERNKRLSETDWTQLPDIPESTKNAWQSYRQGLRDITETYSSLDDVVWPDKP